MPRDLSVLRTAAPTYRRGGPTQPGEPAQLPQGEAQALNEASAGVPTAPVMPGPMQGPPPPPSQIGPPAPPYRPTSDEERFLFQPTERPNQSVLAGVMGGQYGSPPPEAYEALELLRLASSDPTASPQVRFIHDLLLRYM